MKNNALDNLSPEARQRVENALQALGGGVPPQNIFVSQHPDLFPGNMPQETGQYTQDASMPFGGATFPGMNQVSSSQFTDALKQQMGGSQTWAHWEYGPEEWALFDLIDWVPVRNKSRLALIMGPILYLGIIGVLMAVVWAVSQSIDEILFIVPAPAIILLMVLMFVMISAGASIKGAKKRYQARQNQAEPHRVTFSHGGIWEAGTYFSFDCGGLELESVKMTAHPAVLHFKLLKYNFDGSWTGTAENIHILVPRGHEQEAEQLRQRYYAEVIKTRNKPYNPPEPV